MSNIVISDLGSNLDISSNVSITSINSQLSNLTSQEATNSSKHTINISINGSSTAHANIFIFDNHSSSYTASNFGSYYDYKALQGTSYNTSGWVNYFCVLNSSTLIWGDMSGTSTQSSYTLSDSVSQLW